MHVLSVTIGKTAFATLLAFELLLVAVRFRRSPNRSECVWFLLVLVSLGCRVILADLYAARVTSSLVLLFTAGNLGLSLTLASTKRQWSLAVAMVALIRSLAEILGFRNTLPLTLFSMFAVGLVALYPLSLLWRQYQRTGHKRYIWLPVVACTWLLGSALDAADRFLFLREIQCSLWLSLAVLLAVGYLLGEAGYLRGAGLRASLSTDPRMERFRNAYRRLLQTENTLILQDRLLAAGLLAAGVAHEFKNMLASINVCAEFGLSESDPDAKDKSLGAISEHVQLGKRAATELLDKLVRQGREESQSIRLDQDLVQLFRMVQATYRLAGVRFSFVSDGEIRVHTRKGELEQILLNLIRNAVEALNTQNAARNKLVRVHARRVDGRAVLEVIDNAGGVPQDIIATIFEPTFSTTAGTGLGLYLARELTRRNAADLVYTATTDGSCFRIVFSDEDQDQSTP